MPKQWKLYQNYIIIALISLIAVFFLPMVGSEVGLEFRLPNTVAGWTVYIITKVAIVLINILTLDQFIKQAKVNVKDDVKFKEADAYFNEKAEEEEWLTPTQFLSRLYRNKMITTTINSILGVFGLTSAVLTFDWVSMLSYLFTVVIGLIFGWITMNSVEEYWKNDYYKLMLRDKKKKEQKNNDNLT